MSRKPENKTHCVHSRECTVRNPFVPIEEVRISRVKQYYGGEGKPSDIFCADLNGPSADPALSLSW